MLSCIARCVVQGDSCMGTAQTAFARTRCRSGSFTKNAKQRAERIHCHNTHCLEWPFPSCGDAACPRYARHPHSETLPYWRVSSCSFRSLDALPLSPPPPWTNAQATRTRLLKASRPRRDDKLQSRPARRPERGSLALAKRGAQERGGYLPGAETSCAALSRTDCAQWESRQLYTWRTPAPRKL